ncbi:MAG: helix-turn-helix transcriptional regulator [Cellvibrionaceae bacterium]|nr:helix-turn-helix transcriptional regulator [Cellvibrionaceae bacterium]
MPGSSQETPTADAAFGRLMRFWRQVAGLSQAQLSERLATSSRHISFLETGRSRPSRTMIGRLSKEFALPGREANVLLLAAGFLPEAGADGKRLNSRQREQLGWQLAKHEPYPAFVVNDIGDLLLCNRAWLKLLARAGLKVGQGEMNMYHLFFSDEGIRRLIEGWEDFSCALLLQVKEQQLLTGDSKLNELMEWLSAYPGIPANWAERAKAIGFDSSYDIGVRFGSSRYSLRTVVTGVDPVSLALTAQLKLHLFFPGDNDTSAWWQQASDSGELPSLPSHPLLY